MDIPTYIVISAFAASITVIIFLKVFRVVAEQEMEIKFFSVTVIWLSLTVLGEFIYSWAGNLTCSKYLGCVDGFAGYDAFEHLFFGIAGALAIVWLCKHFPKYSILHSEKWKMALTIIATIVLISVLWEIFECAHDALRVDILHQTLFNLRLHINLLDQPTNIDTMGDLTFGLVGSIVGLVL